MLGFAINSFFPLNGTVLGLDPSPKSISGDAILMKDSYFPPNIPLLLPGGVFDPVEPPPDGGVFGFFPNAPSFF